MQELLLAQYRTDEGPRCDPLYLGLASRSKFVNSRRHVTPTQSRKVTDLVHSTYAGRTKFRPSALWQGVHEATRQHFAPLRLTEGTLCPAVLCGQEYDSRRVLHSLLLRHRSNPVFLPIPTFSTNPEALARPRLPRGVYRK